MDEQEGPNMIYLLKILLKTDVIKHRLNMLIEEKKSRLCFSADFKNKEDLINILHKIGDKIVICKIHYDFYDDRDDTLKQNLIELSIKHNFLLMEDRKFIDISSTVEKQYSKFNKWIDMIRLWKCS